MNSQLKVALVSNGLVLSISIALLVVGVPPLLLLVLLLLNLGAKIPLSNLAVAPLELPVLEHLLPAVKFHLDSHLPLSLSLVLILLLQVHDLLVADLVDIVLLLLVEALEVIRLDSMRSQHADLSSWVLSHEIVVSCVFKLLLLLVLPGLVHFVVSVPLLLGQHLVDALALLFVLESLLIVLGLGLLQMIVEDDTLLVEHLIDVLCHFLAHLLLANLLFAPVLLL
mmetsp:Transcript_15589/g.23922  ORF Transcript_15589/g.23922 Transcript_15589/m.23922 type:complete len:225 (-) Transcript_15589:123-797(-)